MIDMDALERQVADVARRVVGPPRPIDALAIARGATQGPTIGARPWLDALRLVAAGAVVALFGALLWVGFIPADRDDTSLPGAVASTAPTVSPAAEPTTQPSVLPERSTRDDLVAGLSLVTEEVEPGVLRIINDGVRDLAWVPAVNGGYCCYYDHAVALAPDGRPWFFRPEGTFALAAPTTPWGAGSGLIPFDGRAPYLVQDLSMWTIREKRLLRATIHENRIVPGVDGASAWTDIRPADGVSVDGSGSISVLTQRRREQPVLTRSDDGGATWTRHRLPTPDGRVAFLGASEDGAVWLGSRSTLYRFDGGEWQAVELPQIEERTEEAPVVELGFDGTVWVRWFIPDRDGYGPADDHDRWARWRDARWTMFEGPEEVPPMSGPHDGGADFEVAPDGALWLTLAQEGARYGECDGLARFDGLDLRDFLSGLCIYNFAIGPDGAVWVAAGADYWKSQTPPLDTYLISAKVAMADR